MLHTVSKKQAFVEDVMALAPGRFTEAGLWRLHDRLLFVDDIYPKVGVIARDYRELNIAQIRSVYGGRHAGIDEAFRVISGRSVPVVQKTPLMVIADAMDRSGIAEIVPEQGTVIFKRPRSEDDQNYDDERLAVMPVNVAHKQSESNYG